MSSLWLSLGSPLFRRAPAEAMLVGGLCGVVGVHVLLRRLAFFTHAAAHAAFTGVVAASLLGVSLLAGGAAGALALVAITSGISSFRRLGHGSALVVLLVLGHKELVLTASDPLALLSALWVPLRRSGQARRLRRRRDWEGRCALLRSTADPRIGLPNFFT